MQLSRRFMLERFLARDRAFDGRFVVGVLSTGIYCLPSCPARNPRPENVRFFEDEESARAAGLRACLRCKPDRFHLDRDPEVELIELLSERVRGAPGDFPEVADLARAAGLGATRLGALLRRHRHESAAGFLARTRIEAACRTLLGTERRVLDVGLDAGYESSSAFHANFRRHTGMTPRAYRRLRDDLTFRVELPTDFRAADTLAYLGRDSGSASERREGDRFLKALSLGGRPRVLELELCAGAARCRLHGAERATPELGAAAHRAARRLLGIDVDPGPFERRIGRDKRLARLVRGGRGLRVPQTADVFEGLVWAVVGQQIHLRFAFACRRALVELAGRPASDGLIAHPTPEELARVDPADLRARKLTTRKSEYLVDVSARVKSGELAVEGLAAGSAVDAERRLLATRGIGPWTARYVLMRGAGFVDCAPIGDSALATALQRFFELPERPDASGTDELMEAFAPYRSLATFHLWRSLKDERQTKTSKDIA